MRARPTGRGSRVYSGVLLFVVQHGSVLLHFSSASRLAHAETEASHRARPPRLGRGEREAGLERLRQSSEGDMYLNRRVQRVSDVQGTAAGVWTEACVREKGRCVRRRPSFFLLPLPRVPFSVVLCYTFPSVTLLPPSIYAFPA